MNENELLEVETEADDGPVVALPIMPVPVSVCDPVVTVATVPQHVSFHTLVLTTDDPQRQLLPLDALRVEALVQALDQDVVLTSSRSQAQSTANTVASLPNPDGAILPKANTTPTRMPATAEVWATAQVLPARVSVIVTRRSP
jgi:hypothetical protein